ncbi:hypothetical protein [Pseudodonghicola flavimaris]|uniref:Ribbon-helix-helix domain-containing protein n=1 Tax=Pseudodonghicola flavimaris TaxID=3050036 RepID=A0ABT7EXZ6_9RHOB|nr:hypothetical protein [Pseudodonghicola flavimaris]MDK3017218.1 hypothetical protein [Pseudodonghicola flavimaris]
MSCPTDARRPCDRSAAPAGDSLWTILADAGVRLGLSVDAVIDRIESETRIWR